MTCKHENIKIVLLDGTVDHSVCVDCHKAFDHLAELDWETADKILGRRATGRRKSELLK